MKKIEALQSKMTSIEAEITRIKDQGSILVGARLELVAPGGTASSKAKQSPKYGRLRMGRGANRRSHYVPLTSIPKMQAAIERGRQITKLQKQANAIKKQIDTIAAKVATLGA